MYRFTGCDTFGFCFFQCPLNGGGEPVPLTRSADRLQAGITSNIENVRIQTDEDAAVPAEDLADSLRESGSDPESKLTPMA